MDGFFTIRLDKKAKEPLYVQLGEGVLEQIARQELPAGSKLPAIRPLAAALGVNPATVAAAYRYLEQKKAVYGQTGGGTFVSPIPYQQVPAPVESLRRWTEPAEAGAINFIQSELPGDLFPSREFGQIFQALLEEEGGDAFRYEDSRGFGPLREVLSRMLAADGLRVPPDQLQIVSGAQQGIDLAAKALLHYGDVVILERPTFSGAAAAFLSRGGRLLDVPLEPDGMDMERLEAYLKLYRPRLVYMMTNFQTPTGISYSLAKKRRLLQLAEDYDFFVIEDDTASDLYYGEERPLPLKALDHRNRVVYIKSFSRILMPGFRLGLMAFPRRLGAAMEKAKLTTDIATSSFLQKAACRYFSDGNWTAHRERVRQFGKERYKKALIFARMAGLRDFTPPGGGVCLWIGTGEKPAEAVAGEARAQGVLVAPGSRFLLDEGESRAFRLCFTGVSEEALSRGMAKIGQILKKR